MKTLLTSILFLFLGFSVFAQLFVRPNATASTDSYVYVDDVVLYVGEEINLELNTNVAATEASIYLRGDAQLIQGTTGASTNLGTGFLSVYQQGFADGFDYNYWCAPVGNASASIGNENFGITKFYDVVGLTESNLAANTSSHDGISSPLTISNRWIYQFITSDEYSEWVYVGSASTIVTGLGFTMKGVDVDSDGSTKQEYDFRGKPNDGTITSSVANLQWTLTGNPYPSAIDLVDFLNDAANNSINATIYYWDSDPTANSHFVSDYEGGYGTWIPTGGTGGTYTPATFYTYDGAGTAGPGTGTMGAPIQRRYAPIGQGFMVEGNGAGATITMKNSFREYVTEGAGNFSEFKSLTTPIDPTGSLASILDDDGTTGQWPKFRIRTLIDDTHIRELVLTFSEKSTMGVDRGMDAKSPMGVSKDVYWSIEDDKDDFNYVIQTVPFSTDLKIPLTLLAAGALTNFAITVTERENFDENIFIYDSFEETYFNINEKVAQLSLDEGQTKGRYFIVFKTEKPKYVEIANEERAKIDFFQNNPLKQLEIYNPDLLNITEALVYDISGKLVVNKQNLGAQNKFIFSTATLSNGIYIVKLRTIDNTSIVEKVRVYNQ